MKHHHFLEPLLVLAFLAVLSSCSRTSDDEVSPADTLIREHVASLFNAKDPQFGKARTELAPLVTRARPALQDLVDAASIEFADGQIEAARAFLDRAARIDAKVPAVLYLQGQILRISGELKAARQLFRAAHAAVPSDLPTTLALAEVEYELKDAQAAEALYESVIAKGIENGQSWYVMAIFRMSRLLIDQGRDAEAERYNTIWRVLEKTGIRQLDSLTMSLGNLGRVRPPRPAHFTLEEPKALPPYKPRELVLPELAEARELLRNDLDADLYPDLTAVGERGVVAALSRETGYTVRTIVTGGATWALPFDLDNDGDLDFLVLQQDGLHVHTYDKEEWTRSSLELPAIPSEPIDALAVDFDHEGDLDLLLVGAFGARLWRNDGAAVPQAGGGFTDASDIARLPADRAFEWCMTEDFDGDNDVDLLLGGKSGVYLADSQRAGVFADKTRTVFGEGARIEHEPIVADLDGDARPDLWTPSAIWHQEKDGRLERVAGGTDSNVRAASLCAADVDLDGTLDVVWATAQGLAIARLAAGLPVETDVVLTSDPKTEAVGPMCIADFDGNDTVDLAFGTKDGVRVFDGAPMENHGVRISYRGLRDNRRAVGAIVEYRAERVYRRIYWRGEPELVGVGKAPKLDVLRITWPNGTVNTDLDLDLRPQVGVDDVDAAFSNILQPSGQVGSCPFLYAWNGDRFVFVSDVLGVTPLGLPIAPGVFVPPDHDEYVLVTGDQLKPKDGFFELNLTEELREVTYLDRALLHVVDHPVGTEVFPNERFTFPPFPAPHIHSVEDPIAPVRALGSDGRDWTKELASIDDVHARPFELLPSQFGGLAKPWFLELEFDRAALANAKKLRLLMTGWLFWSDASSNMASARHPGIEFVPPLFQVPDGSGGWKNATPPVGFPAGKTKTMVIDVSDVLSREDPRLRVFSTLRLYWDALRLAVDGDDAETVVTSLDPYSAGAWMRGFSAPLRTPEQPGCADCKPERFDWTKLADRPRWNQHPGMYTRHGECLALVQAVDDQFVILGSGDALTLRFDARTLPPPKEGFVRDYLVYLDGWAKDRDPNTILALEVEPLPFHAMSGYPYRDDESYPSDEAHAKYRREWNTRPGATLIPPVSPQREVEWLLGDTSQ